MKPDTKHNTIVSIANRTGFSVSTVSRVLSGKAKSARISEKTVQIISEEARQLDYKPSLIAKGLPTTSFDNAFFANLTSSIILEARPLAYSIVTEDTLENEKELGFKVIDDVSIMALDNKTFMRYLDHPVTCISQKRVRQANRKAFCGVYKSELTTLKSN